MEGHSLYIVEDNLKFCSGPANSVTILWDQIMTSLECCGVSNFNDFASVPASCCIDDAFNSTVTGLASCPDPTTGTLPLQMLNGCFPLLVRGSIPAIASSLAVVVLFQVRNMIKSLNYIKIILTPISDCRSDSVLLPGEEGGGSEGVV